jgi:hypothetical protein
MGGYGGEIVRSVSEAMAGLGGWFREVGHRITHDPLWGVITLIVVRRRAG